jgi:hypothetical protein
MLTSDGDPELSLRISSPVGASGTLTIPGLGITNAFMVAAGAVTNISITSDAMMVDYDTNETYGIHITASRSVSVYALEFDRWASAAFTGYPTTLLGTNYCVMAHASATSESYDFGFNMYSQLAVVATADNATVTIIPSATANLDGQYGTNYCSTNAYTETLQQGQTYQINSLDDADDGGINDVTGTLVKSDKPIAVFAGADLACVPDDNTPYANPLVQEQLPVDLWGTQALALSFAGRTNGDSYRVLAAYSNTVVAITGDIVTNVSFEGSMYPTVTSCNETVMVTNQAGQCYDLIVIGPVVFQASQPIQVAHFAIGGEYDHPSSHEGDPCEILLPPTGHYLETNIVFTLTNDLPDKSTGTSI